MLLQVSIIFSELIEDNNNTRWFIRVEVEQEKGEDRETGKQYID